MIKWLFLCLLLLALSAAPALPADAAQFNQGLQGGWAIADDGSINFVASVTDTLPYMQEAGAGWVRINFRLACYENWTDVHQGRCTSAEAKDTALAAYDAVIAQAHARNLKVLGLLSNESWHGTYEDRNANSAGSGDNAYVRAFATNAAGVLAAHFGPKADEASCQDTVHICQWEVWNEPNAWRGDHDGTYIDPSNFAWLLKLSYQAIKTATQQKPNVTVISGGLFGTDQDGASFTVSEGGQLKQVTKHADIADDRRPSAQPEAAQTCRSTVTSGAKYFCATYEMGISKAGWVKPYPFDHVGQHIYIDPDRATTSKKLSTYLKDVRNAYVLYEGTNTPKRTHITEFGWQTPPASESTQANNLKTAYAAFKNTNYVSRAYWFSIQDVPYILYGLLRGDYSKKPAFSAYQAAAAY